jgi:hypothetical protein
MTIRLFLLQPEIIFAARVNQATITYPLLEVTFDGVTTGAYTDIIPGMTVVFGSSAGASDLGRQRIRKVATSDTLYMGRSSRGTNDGEIDIADDTYITVWNDYRVWGKIPYSVVTEDGGDVSVIWYKDGDFEVGTWTTNLPPVSNIGPGVIATIDGSDIITVDFDSANSLAMSDGATITGYEWDVADGSIITGTSTSSAITATFPAGFRWVSLKVTDSNGRTHTSYAPVVARDPDDDICIDAFAITEHRITQTGQTISVRVLEDIDISTYPDGTLVMVADDEPASESDRGNMLFIGWHQSDPAAIQAGRTGNLRDVTLNCVDAAGRLATLPGFSQSLRSAESPAEWTEMVAPNIDKYLHYLLYWHSSVFAVADWTPSGTGDDFPFVEIGSENQSLLDQVQWICQSMTPDYKLTCNTLGQLRVIVDPMLQDSGDRTSVVQKFLSEYDYTEIRYTQQHVPTVYQLYVGAIKALSALPTDDNGEPYYPLFFSQAPGTGPGQGVSERKKSEKIAISQADLNSCVGHEYARINALQGPFQIKLTGGDDFDIEPSDMAWVTLSLGAEYAAQRGLNFTVERGLPLELNIRYDDRREGLVRTIELTWERETSGTPGVTVIQPESDYQAPDALTPGEWEKPLPLPPDQGLFYGDIGAYVMWDGAHVYRTMDFSDASPVWEFVDTSITGTIYDGRYVVINDTVAMWLLTSDGIWLCADILATTPSWTLKLANTTIQSTEVQPPDQATIAISIATWGYDPNYLVVATGLDVTNDTDNIDYAYAYMWHTHDLGDNWTTVQLTETYTGAFGHTRAYAVADLFALEMYRDADGIIYCARAAQVYATQHRLKVFKSDDQGDTWSTAAQYYSDYASPSWFALLHPYPGRTDPCYLVYGGSGVSERSYLMESDDEFETSAAVLADNTPTGYGGVAYSLRPNSDPNDPDHLLVWALYKADYPTQVYHLMETFDAGASWSMIYSTDEGEKNVTFPTGTRVNPGYCAPNGWPVDSDQWIIIKTSTISNDVTNVVQFTDDRFSTLVSKEGNLYTLLGGDNWTNGVAGGIALPKVGANT